MLIASESESGHFMPKCINWNAVEKIFICRARIALPPEGDELRQQAAQ
jgi:hypothetical protein